MKTVTYDDKKFSLVPVEPTPEMIQAGIDTPCIETGDDTADQWEDYRIVYSAMLAAAPTIKQSLTVEEEDASRTVSGEQVDGDSHAPAAQNVDALVEELDSMVCAYRSAIATGYDRINALGGECDAVDYMLAAFPGYAKAKALVAAHRAQQAKP